VLQRITDAVISIAWFIKTAQLLCCAVFLFFDKGEITMKKLASLILAAAMLLALCACGTENQSPAEKTYTVGICQLVQHSALDAATEGFKAALTEKLGDKVTFLYQNASGDSATCATICSQFVSEDVDLIMANATPALQAAAAATNIIPILGTSISDYGTALGIDSWTGKTGTNISGTSDLAPLDGQAAMISELFPDAKVVGILFCSGEANSRYQADVITPYLKAAGLEVKEFTFSDSNDIAAVTASACADCDVIYIPTDNTAASCTEAINNVALEAGVPIITGDEGTCKGCGVATLAISYYDLGYTTGEMAAEVLLNGANVPEMEIKFAPNVEKEYNADVCAALGITIPADYTAIA